MLLYFSPSKYKVLITRDLNEHQELRLTILTAKSHVRYLYMHYYIRDELIYKSTKIIHTMGVRECVKYM